MAHSKTTPPPLPSLPHVRTPSFSSTSALIMTQPCPLLILIPAMLTSFLSLKTDVSAASSHWRRLLVTAATAPQPSGSHLHGGRSFFPIHRRRIPRGSRRSGRADGERRRRRAGEGGHCTTSMSSATPAMTHLPSFCFVLMLAVNTWPRARTHARIGWPWTRTQRYTRAHDRSAPAAGTLGRPAALLVTCQYLDTSTSRLPVPRYSVLAECTRTSGHARERARAGKREREREVREEEER